MNLQTIKGMQKLSYESWKHANAVSNAMWCEHVRGNVDKDALERAEAFADRMFQCYMSYYRQRSDLHDVAD